MRESNPAKDETEQTDDPATNEIYHPTGHARNLCLVWPDGKRAFFNYAYLVSADFAPDGDTNLIRLGFSSQNVLLKGYRLENLFMLLLDHMPRIITAIDPRYIQADTELESIVTSIEIEAME